MGIEPGRGPTRSADDGGLLSALRATHTLAFLVELGSIGWLLATALTGRRDQSVAITAGLVAIESAEFIANDDVCPMTRQAERLGASRGSVSDVYLPDALARTVPIWSSALIAMAGLLHVRGLVRARTADPRA